MKRILHLFSIIVSFLSSLFPKTEGIHRGRFALPHELSLLFTQTLDGVSLLMGSSHLSGLYRVRATDKRRELGNVLIEAPTGGGKGLLAVCQILTWGSSMIVFDIKGDLYKQTAGYRATLGPVYRFDTRGYGNTYDPFQGKESEDELYGIANQLMFEPHEGDGKAFTQKGTKMLTIAFLAGREANRQAGRTDAPLVPFVGHMADLGLNRAAKLIDAISPDLCRRFLDEDYNLDKDYTENKYLANSWESVTARLFPLLTDRILRCFSGSDFAARDIIGGRKPVTVYLCIPEKDLHAKAPVIRLVLESLMAEMKDYFDDAPGETAAEKGCREVLDLLDEAGNIGLPSLPQDVATVRSRGISIWASYQDNAQIEHLYGRFKARALRNNMDTKIIYRQGDFETARDIAQSLGDRSVYAHSQTYREGEEASASLSEQAQPVLTPRDINELDPEEIIGFFYNLKPFRARRMDWRNFPVLVKRRALPPPPVAPLPKFPAVPIETLAVGMRRSDKGWSVPEFSTPWQESKKKPCGVARNSVAGSQRFEIFRAMRTSSDCFASRRYLTSTRYAWVLSGSNKRKSGVLLRLSIT
jgi:type IV secretion system protein VirD4